MEKADLFNRTGLIGTRTCSGDEGKTLGTGKHQQKTLVWAGQGSHVVPK